MNELSFSSAHLANTQSNMSATSAASLSELKHLVWQDIYASGQLQLEGIWERKQAREVERTGTQNDLA